MKWFLKALSCWAIVEGKERAPNGNPAAGLGGGAATPGLAAARMLLEQNWSQCYGEAGLAIHSSNIIRAFFDSHPAANQPISSWLAEVEELRGQLVLDEIV
jgi:hypothetical protein